MLTPEEYGAEISRRYDINGNKALTFGEAKEWAFCLAPFLDHPPPISDPENKNPVVTEKPVPEPEKSRGPDGPDEVGNAISASSSSEADFVMEISEEPEVTFANLGDRYDQPYYIYNCPCCPNNKGAVYSWCTLL